MILLQRVTFFSLALSFALSPIFSSSSGPKHFDIATLDTMISESERRIAAIVAGDPALQALAKKMLTANEATLKNTPASLGDLLLALTTAGIDTDVTILLTTGVDINCTDAYGNTPLITAINYGHDSIAMKLIRADAHVSLRNIFGFDALDFALSSNKAAIVAALRAAGAIDR